MAYDDQDDVNLPLSYAQNDADNNDIEIGQVNPQKLAGQVQAQMKEEIATQSDQHKAPPPPTFCLNLFNWFPLRFFCFIGGALLVACTALDWVFNKDAFVQTFIRIYLFVFGIVTMMIESPLWKPTRYFQLHIFFWFRILSRMWGRAWFYAFITILCWAEFESGNPAEFTIVAGFYMFAVCLLSFMFSKLSATKFNRMFVFIASGSEGDELVMKFEKKYIQMAELNANGEKLGSAEITKLATEAGRQLSNAERYAIQTFLDESCNGFVSKDDFIKQFCVLTNKKQRFL